MVVHDADLRMHVDGVGDGLRSRRACRRGTGQPIVGFHELGESAARVIGAGVGLLGSTMSTRKRSLGGRCSLSRRIAVISGDHQELVLEIDELLCAARAPRYNWRDAELSTRDGPSTRSGTVRTIWIATASAVSTTGATGAIVSPVTSCHRIRKCSATRPRPPSRSDAYRRRASRRPPVGCERCRRTDPVLARQVDAAHECDAVVDDDRLLVMTVQRALLRVEGPLILVPAQTRSRIFRTARREGRKSGSGAPAHVRTRTSIRDASSASRFRRTVGASPRVRANSGETSQPARCTCDCACRSSAAIRGSASAPSIRTSSEPRRGGVPLPDQSSGEAPRTSHPIRWSRRR